MKAILKFDLDNIDDEYAHRRCVKSLDMALALWDFSNELRKLRNNLDEGENLNEERVWEAWTDALNDKNINLDNLLM